MKFEFDFVWKFKHWAIFVFHLILTKIQNSQMDAKKKRLPFIYWKLSSYVYNSSAFENDEEESKTSN